MLHLYNGYLFDDNIHQMYILCEVLKLMFSCELHQAKCLPVCCSCFPQLCYVISCHTCCCAVMFCYGMLYYVMLYCVMMCYVWVCFYIVCLIALPQESHNFQLCIAEIDFQKLFPTITHVDQGINNIYIDFAIRSM